MARQNWLSLENITNLHSVHQCIIDWYHWRRKRQKIDVSEVHDTRCLFQSGPWSNRFITVRCGIAVPSEARNSAADAVCYITAILRKLWYCLSVLPRGRSEPGIFQAVLSFDHWCNKHTQWFSCQVFLQYRGKLLQHLTETHWPRFFIFLKEFLNIIIWIHQISIKKAYELYSKYLKKTCIFSISAISVTLMSLIKNWNRHHLSNI